MQSLQNHVEIKNFPGGTTETTLEEVEELVKNKPETVIVHAGTNDLTKGKTMFNNVKKKIKSVKRFSRQTKLMFSSLIFEKIKSALTKKHICVHLQDHLDIKKFYLDKRGNSVFAQNLLRFLRSKYWGNVNFKYFTESYDEYKSENLNERLTDSTKKIWKIFAKKAFQILLQGNIILTL